MNTLLLGTMCLVVAFVSETEYQYRKEKQEDCIKLRKMIKEKPEWTDLVEVVCE